MEEESHRHTKSNSNSSTNKHNPNNSSSLTRAKTKRQQLHKPQHDQKSHLFQYSDQNLNLVVSSATHSHFLHSYYNYYYQYHHHHPPLLPLPPPLLPLPPSKSRFLKPFSPSSDTHFADSSVSPVPESKHQRNHVSQPKAAMSSTAQALVVAKRPDSGGKEGSVICLLANHFLVKFEPSQRFYHYDVEISPRPSKEVAWMIKRKLVATSPLSFSGAVPAFDGRKNVYSPVEFQNDRLEFFVNLPIIPSGVLREKQHKKVDKLFRVNMRLVSKFDGKEINSFLNKEGEDWIPLPQEYIHALDVILRENPMEKSISVGRSSFYSSSMGGSKEIGGGAVGLRGFFQSLRPTQQGLALNVDFSITAFHESVGVIPYLQKRLEFLKDLNKDKARELSVEERKEVAKALKNIRVFVCHRETVQRYRVSGLTDDITENLWFPDRGGKNLRLISYFKDQYNYDIRFRNLPCLQISRNRPCYLPMELCMICEGQKFLGKLSDDQTAKILKMGCLRPKERKSIIDGVMRGPVGPSSGNQAREFNLEVSREMTLLKGRILQPPKLKLGGRGLVRDVTPSRHDRQWNFLESQVFEGTRIERWALLSFGGNQDRRSTVTKFISQLSQKCERLGIFLSKNTITSPLFEPSHLLNNVSALESKIKEIHRAASNDLQLLVCVMEKKHKGYGDLKRIAETNVGVITQCCLYPNIAKSNSQFLANLALKINAKAGGCTVALYNSLPSQIPRLLTTDEPVIFMGADVTHPHPFDDCSPSVAAVVGSINWPAANRYVSRMRSQTHRQEIIQDLAFMVKELLDDFHREVKKLPRRIMFFRDGVSETQFKKVLQEELRAIKAACSKFPCYNPRVTFAVVQKRHHTRLFPCDPDRSSSKIQPLDENIPPGTVVDTAITHPREFDFFLCSHWGVKGTSRPTHYHILWDENEFTSDELQRLVYSLCYTFVRCTKPVSIVPPAYYAHLAAYRGRLYIERSSDSTRSMSRVGPPKTIPLPKLTENVKNFMFYC